MIPTRVWMIGTAVVIAIQLATVVLDVLVRRLRKRSTG